MASKRPIRKGVRAAIAITGVTLLVNNVFDFGETGFYGTFATFLLLVLADFGGPARSRFWAYITAGIGGMALITLGAVVVQNMAVTLVVTAILVFVMAYLVVLRGYVERSFLCLLMPYVVSVTNQQPLHSLPEALLAFAIGTIVAAAAALVLWPIYRTSDIRKAVSNSLGVAARLLATTAPMKPGASHEHKDAMMRELVSANQALGEAFDGKPQRPGSATTRDRGLVQLVDDLNRLRVALRWPGVHTDEVTPDDLALLKATQETLDACGKAMIGAGPVPSATAVLEARINHINALPVLATKMLERNDGADLQQSVNASFYYRMTAFLTAMIVRHTQIALGAHPSEPPAEVAKYPNAETIAMFNAATSPKQILRSHFNLRSPWFRRALQTAVGVTIAIAVVLTFHIQHGFWVILGITAALQLSAGDTRKTALGAIIGTSLGFIITAIMFVVIGDNTIALTILLPFIVFIATCGPSGRYEFPLRQAGFTVLFVLLGSLANGMTLSLSRLRLQDVAIGLLICLFVATAMWPKGVASEVRRVITESVGATAKYFATAYEFITSDMGPEQTAKLQQTGHAAVQARIRADDAYDAAISQGGDTGISAKSWDRVVNSVDHVFFAATLVSAMQYYKLAPVPFSDVASCMRKDALDIAKMYTQSINEIYASQTPAWNPPVMTAQVRTPTGIKPLAAGLDPVALAPQVPQGHDLQELTDMINSQITDCNGHSGEINYQIDDEEFTMTYGEGMISMLWAQDWLLYFHWLASYTVTSAESAR